MNASCFQMRRHNIYTIYTGASQKNSKYSIVEKLNFFPIIKFNPFGLNLDVYGLQRMKNQKSSVRIS